MYGGITYNYDIRRPVSVSLTSLIIFLLCHLQAPVEKGFFITLGFKQAHMFISGASPCMTCYSEVLANQSPSKGHCTDPNPGSQFCFAILADPLRM